MPSTELQNHITRVNLPLPPIIPFENNMQHIELEDFHYLKSTLTAIANGNELPTPTGLPTGDWWPKRTFEAFDELCLGGLIQYLINRSTVTPTWEFLADRSNIHSSILKQAVDRFRLFQNGHELREKARLRREAQEQLLLDRTPAEFERDLTATLAHMTEEGGWYDLVSTNIDQLPLCDGARNRFLIMQAFATGKFKTLVEIAKSVNVSSARVRQVIEKDLRRWRHPGRYGEVFRITYSGGPESKQCRLEIFASGGEEPTVHENLTFSEVVVLANKRLAALGSSLMVQFHI